jgi:protein phosphatase
MAAEVHRESDGTDLHDTWDFPFDDPRVDRPQPYSSLVSVDVEALSHEGHVRARNEDAFLVYRASRTWERLRTNLPDEDIPERFDETAYVFCVADGMGGLAAGDVASRLAIRTGVNLVLNSARWWLKLDCPETRAEAMQAFAAKAVKRFSQIDKTLLQEGNKSSVLFGMGTTLTVACSFGADLFVFHVGDSRAYLFRDGTLAQLTRDQTMAQVLLETGVISAEQAKSHRGRHALTGLLGGRGSKDAPEVHMLRLKNGDQLLLCTDGLTNMLDNAAINRVLASSGSAEEGCRRLVDEALQQGGRDNVTAIVARYTLPDQH